MFNRKRENPKPRTSVADNPFPFFDLEPLEGRRLLSGSFGHGHGTSTIQFDQASTAVQAGLDALATADNLTAPASTSTQTVYLRNANGVESYTIDITGTGTVTALTVDQNGNPVTAPTKSTTTFGAITSTTVTAEITAIATALSLTAPTSTTSVSVSTAANNVATYTVRLASSTTTTTGRHARSTTISVDSNGDPVGNQSIPFSVLPTAIQGFLNAHVPTGSTALATTSTQTVTVRTLNGVTSYSVTFTGTGTTTTISVNSTGTLVTLPSTSSVDFDTLPTAAQTELQTLATADGVTTTIASTQTVSAYNEGNGTTIYTVTLSGSGTDSSGNATTTSVTISVDENGNPTVLPNDAGGGGGSGGCGNMGGSGFAGSGTTDSGGSDLASTAFGGFGGFSFSSFGHRGR